MNFILRPTKTGLLLVLLAIIALQPSQSKAQIIWGTATGAEWTTGSNWVGGLAPAAGQIAEFDVNPTSATTGVGIDMNIASSAVNIGAVNISATRSNNFLIGNSSVGTPGVLYLSGATVGGIPNVLIANNSSNRSTLTLQNIQGVGLSTLGVDLGSSGGKILAGVGTSTAAGNAINITAQLSGTGPVTFLGSGTWDATSSTGLNGGLLKLGNSNTFSGGMTIGNADGSQSGILELDAPGAVGNYAGNYLTINSNSQLYLAGYNNAVYTTDSVILNLAGQGNGFSVTGRGALINVNGNSYTWTSPIHLSSDAGITVNGSSANMTLNGLVSGAGNLIKLGAGNLNLNGSNTWAGGTTITAGKITVNSGSSLGSGPLVFSQSGSNATTLALNNASQSVAYLASSFSATSGTIAQNITLGTGCNLIINQDTSTTFGSGVVATLRSNISGGGSVIKAGAGVLTFTSASHSFTGGMTITGGELRWAMPAATSVSMSSCPVTMNGGTLGTKGIGANPANSITFGTVALNDNSIISLDSTNQHSIKFSSSNAVSWVSGKTLRINGWIGTFNGTAGTKGRIYVGTTATGLTASQLAQVKFSDALGNLYNAVILSTGEIVPASPTITTGAFVPGLVCINSPTSVSVPFTTTGPLTGVYKVQISNASGVFASDTVSNIIGSGTSSPIGATIPAGDTASTLYKVRVINGAPQVVFGSASTAFTITGYPHVAAISGLGMLAAGTTRTMSDSTTGGVWSTYLSSIATVSSTGVVTGIGAGIDTIYYSVTNGCSLTTIVAKVETVAAVPSVSSVTPSFAIPGANITIAGQNFNTSAVNNKVYFNGVKGIVTAATATSLSVTLPRWAGTGLVSVIDTTTYESGASANVFVPVYNNYGLIPDTTHFKPKVDVSTGTSPIGLIAGDLDGDGMSDLVVVNSGPNNIYVYQRTDTTSSLTIGSYGSPITLNTGIGPHYARLADMDGDGKLDILVVNTSSNTISILRNTSTLGSISFAAKVDYATGGLASVDLGVADFDGDGRLDIASVNKNSNTISILRNNGLSGPFTASSFLSPVTFATGINPCKIVCTDLDSDGHVDMSVVNYAANTASLFHNTAAAGSITSSSFAAPLTLTTGSTPTGIAFGDINGDGKPELLATNAVSNTLSVFLNTSPAAGSMSFATKVDFATGAGPEDVAVADINGDGKLDVVVACYYTNSVSVYRNRGLSGSITAASLATRADQPASAGPAGLLVTDLDGDNKPDIAVANGSSATLSLIKNYPLPPIGPISGIGLTCVGVSTPFTDTVAGGQWLSSTPSVGTISSAGLYTAVGQGYDTISYFTVAQGDTNVTTYVVHVLAVPAAMVTTGSHSVCTGAYVALSNASGGGVWSSSDTTVASIVASGIVSAISTGNAIMSYTVTNFCGTTIDTFLVHVSPSSGYTIGSISAPGHICRASAIPLTDTSVGGHWSTSSAVIAAIDSTTGIVTGYAYGSAILSYTKNSSCGLYIDTFLINVDTPFSAVSISGAAAVCQGANITLSHSGATSGTWSVSNTSASAAGPVIHGLVGGIDTVIYSATNSCGTVTATWPVVVNPLPVVHPINGPTVVCAGSNITLSDSTSGGAWSRTNGHANISGTGVLTAVSAGIDTVKYTVSNSCGPTVVTLPVTINHLATTGAIVGPNSVCLGSTISLFDTTAFGAGTWSVTDTSKATILGGVVTPIVAGTDSVIFTVITSCNTVRAVKVVSLVFVPYTTAIVGVDSICAGSTRTLTDSALGGVWSVTNGFASISSTLGILTASASQGLDTVRYLISNSCGTSSQIHPIFISKVPNVGVLTGPSVLCVGGSITLRDSVVGGTWSVVNGNLSHSDSVFNGVSVGTDSVLYSFTNVCGTYFAIKKITIQPVLPDPGVISGASSVCVGASITLTDSASGGIWGKTNATANVYTGGVVKGVSAGIDTIKYTVTNSCGPAVAYHVVSVLPLAQTGSISGPNSVCQASSIIIKDTASGGVWTVTNKKGTLVDTVFTGVIPGIDTIKYLVTNSCGTLTATKVVTVNALPVVDTITGPREVFVGDTIILKDGSSGGVWSSTQNNAIVTSSGLAGGLSQGIDTIKYTITNGCGHISALLPLNILDGTGLSSITDISVYPSPSNGVFTLKVSAMVNEQIEIVIASADYRIVKFFSIPTNTPVTVNFEEAAGVYYLSAVVKPGWSTVKFVIVR